jgi:O-antigen ligase
MAAWVTCLLVALVVLKPQEFVPALAGLPLVHLAFAGVIVAAARERLHGRLRGGLAPQVPYVLAFFAWALFVTAVKAPAALGVQALPLVIVAGLFLAVATCCATPAGLRAFAVTLTACAAVVTVTALVQSTRPLGCFLAEPDDWEGRGELAPDGRPCATSLDCQKAAPVPDSNYRCEQPGPLGTSTIGGRVRYRGSLADPNELSLALAIALPFALALATRPREASPPRAPRVAVPLPPLLTDAFLRRLGSLVRGAPALAFLVATGAVVVLSRSRSGLLAYLTVLGLLAIRRAGAWGVVAACFFAPPLVLLGGRSGAEADESAGERVEILREAFEMMRTARGVGLGGGQFSDTSSLGMTAHNAYVLAAAEAGLVGLWLFVLALYLSLKVPVVVWLDGRGGRAARFAPGIAAAICGAMVGILFLSWSYKDVLYLLLGASAALGGAARAEDPGLEVRLSVKEAGLAGMAAVVLLGAVYVGARWHSVH